MSAKALVLAAHGSRHESRVNAQIRAWARQIEQEELFDEVAAAFHQGAPAFRDVLDQLKADDVTIVPVMTSAGYYYENVLPKELAKNHRFGDIHLRLTAPLGTTPAIAGMVSARVENLLQWNQLDSGKTTVALVGHGTRRHPASRNATCALEERLGHLRRFGEVVSFFLDDDPPLEELPLRTTQRNIVVVPFLIAPGPHALIDIPRRIGIPVGENEASRELQFARTRCEVGGRNVLCDVPVGSYPGIVDLILELACAGKRECVFSTDMGVA